MSRFFKVLSQQRKRFKEALSQYFYNSIVYKIVLHKNYENELWPQNIGCSAAEDWLLYLSQLVQPLKTALSVLHL
jgi:hypothetical protein